MGWKLRVMHTSAFYTLQERSLHKQELPQKCAVYEIEIAPCVQHLQACGPCTRPAGQLGKPRTDVISMTQ